jgi:hypothetical protein
MHTKISIGKHKNEINRLGDRGSTNIIKMYVNIAV